MSDVFDISAEAVSDTSTVMLDRPNGDPLNNPKGEQCSVTVYGPGSKAFARAQGAKNRALMAFVKRGGKKMADDEQREIDAEFLATCTVSFNGFSYKGLTGHEQFKQAYMDSSIGYIAEQVNRHIGDWANFTKPASAT